MVATPTSDNFPYFWCITTCFYCLSGWTFCIHVILIFLRQTMNLHRFFQTLRLRAEHISTEVAIVLFFFIGLGLTATVARIVRRTFLQKQFSNSSWQPYTESQSLQKQY